MDRNAATVMAEDIGQGLACTRQCPSGAPCSQGKHHPQAPLGKGSDWTEQGGGRGRSRSCTLQAELKPGSFLKAKVDSGQAEGAVGNGAIPAAEAALPLAPWY